MLGIAMFSGGCNTAVGNYFANRGRDLSECLCVDVGGGLGLGVGVSASGLLHAGLGVGMSADRMALGIEYGHAFAFGANTSPKSAGSRIELWLPIPVPATGHGPNSTHQSSYRCSHSVDRVDEHYCAAILPGVPLTEISEHVLNRRWSRVHAWDIEASAFAGVIYARVGFSPGEFLDFLLGWFGVDIAGDDRAEGG